MKKLYFLIGISGSGKSTYIKSHFIPEVVVSPDELRKKLTGDVSNQSQNGKIWGMVPNLLQKSLEQYGKAVLDATNVDSGDRASILKKFDRNEVERIAVIFDINPEEAKKRIHKDIETGADRSVVPDDIVDRQHEKFKRGYNSIKQQFDKVIDGNKGKKEMNIEENVRLIVRRELSKALKEDAQEEMEKASYQAYNDMYLVPQSNWRVKTSDVNMYDDKGFLHKGQIGEVHKLSTIEYDFMHEGEVVTECDGKTYTVNSEDFKNGFERVNDEEGEKVNNESIINEKEEYTRIVEKRPISVTVEKSWTGNYFVINVPPMSMKYETFNELGDNLTADAMSNPDKVEKNWGVRPSYTEKQSKYPNDVHASSYSYQDGKASFTASSQKDIDNWLKQYDDIVVLDKKSAVREDIKKLSSIKDYYGKNIKEVIERLEKHFINEWEYEDSDGQMTDPENYDNNKQWTPVFSDYYFDDSFTEDDLITLIDSDDESAIMVSKNKEDKNSVIISFKKMKIWVDISDFQEAVHNCTANGLIEYDSEGNDDFYYFTEKGNQFAGGIKYDLKDTLKKIKKNN